MLINANDGNNNFNRSLVQNKISVVSEMNLAWRNYGLFRQGPRLLRRRLRLRHGQASGGFPHLQLRELFGGDANSRQFPDGTVDEHRDRLEMLDYFLFASGELPGDHLFDVRLGSQVINWGEATFSSGINGLQNRADLDRPQYPRGRGQGNPVADRCPLWPGRLAPQCHLRSLLPVRVAKTELNGVGSFFSDRDFLGPGAENFLVGIGENAVIPVIQGNEEKPRTTGQWGAALHWITEGGTDFGLYYVNAHNKAPAYQLNYAGAIPTDYTIRYFEDIQGYAASFTTVLGVSNVQGEVSYKTMCPWCLPVAIRKKATSYQPNLVAPMCWNRPCCGTTPT